jgi:23S rRNA pseudouridine1911/1915/1917 synthase
LAGLRLDIALSNHPEIESRSQATNLISRNLVKLGNKAVKPSYKTQLGQIFNVIIEIQEYYSPQPYDFKLDILYEDDDLLVVNKPSGLVVHPAVGHHQDTLVNALLHYTNSLAKGFNIGRPGIVHRIDKDTSGLLVIAKNDSALRSLSAQFKNKTVHRVYWCVCYGHFRLLSGTVKTYLHRHPRDRKRFASVRESSAPLKSHHGKLATTHYSVKKTSPAGFTFAHCRLETGRTHQIRVHMSELGHAIVADPIYCTSHRMNSLKSPQMRNKIGAVPHLMLHAAELGFIHPTSKKQLSFSAPWPNDVHEILRDLDFYDI